VKYYNNNVKPLAQKYVKPATHYVLDPVWNHPVTKWVVNKVPGAKKVTNFLGKVGNALGIW
jgi:hypothetical protein